MTHKNPELRQAGLVKSRTESSTASSVPSEQQKRPPPRIELEGNKWIIENHDQNPKIILEEIELKQVVYIYKCTSSTIQIKGKVNAITMDQCKKVGLVVDSCVSSIELVGCQSCQVQIIHTVPTVMIDKSDGVQIYLSEAGCETTQILSSKCSELNIIPQSQTGEETIELPIPEQFRTVVKQGRLVTELVSHTGG